MPKCPKCDSQMTLRIAEKGKNAGGYFYGCNRYPLCHGIVEKEDPNADSKITLPRNHPFIVEALRLRKLEDEEGCSNQVIDGRAVLHEKYPEYFAVYMNVKKAKSESKLAGEQSEKKRQIRSYGSETVTYSKLKSSERINKNLKQNEI